MDAIVIQGLRVYAYHGVKPEEKEKGQPFELDIEVKANLSAACDSDDLSRAVNYSDVVRCVRETMLSEKNNLIERAAQRVADAILTRFPADEVTVTLKKPRAPLEADFGYVAVRITRYR